MLISRCSCCCSCRCGRVPARERGSAAMQLAESSTEAAGQWLLPRAIGEYNKRLGRADAADQLRMTAQLQRRWLPWPLRTSRLPYAMAAGGSARRWHGRILWRPSEQACRRAMERLHGGCGPASAARPRQVCGKRKRAGARRTYSCDASHVASGCRGRTHFAACRPCSLRCPSGSTASTARRGAACAGSER